MRLICPNCDAQYEVPPEVMPEEGRDVQCSNCGQTWFQHHPDHAPLDDPDADQVDFKADDTAEEFEDTRHPDDTDDDEEWPDASHGHDAAVHRDHPGEDDTPDDAQDTAEQQDEPSGPDEQPFVPGAKDDATPKPRRELDPTIAEVLRAEAEREAQVRKQESTIAMESQPDLGLPEAQDSARDRAREAQERMARVRDQNAAYGGDYDEEEEELLSSSSVAMASRRELLPDIEEINSTLRSNSDRSAVADPGQTAQIEEQEKRRSRLGFSLTVALVAVLALAYVFAPQIAETVPQSAPLLDSYVAAVDSWRTWLDGQMTALLTWLDDVASSSGQ